MSNKPRKFDTSQMSIFDMLKRLSAPDYTSEGHLNIINELRTAMRAAIKQSPLSVHQIAGEMSHLLGETVTREMIYSWTRESDEINGRPGRHVPAEYLPAFCAATQCNGPLEIIGRRSGFFVLPGPEALRAEIKQIEEEIDRARKRKRQRVSFLREMEKELA